MRYIVMHKTDPKMESGAPPDMEIVKQMGGLIGESLRSKTFLDGAGLHPSKRRVRVTCTGGACDLVRGPYQGKNELVARMLLVRTADQDAAIDVAKRLATAIGDAEIEVGPVVEQWDLTGSPKPSDVVGEQYLLLVKGDGDGAASKTKALEAELTASGVLQKQHHIGPSAQGKRLKGPRAQGSKTAALWTDGPFAESKELIAGFSILDVPSLADAVAWADRYAAILFVNEVDVRPMA